MSEDYAKAVESYASAFRMVEDTIGHLFGPIASLADPDSFPVPTPEQRAELVIEALQSVAAHIEAIRPAR